MKYIIIGLSLLGFAYGQCPPNGCPEPIPPFGCQAPDCSVQTNRYHVNALFAHPDPNQYWQCAPLNATHWAALNRWCACGSVFNINTRPPRCTFWWEAGWQVPNGCNWQNPPLIRDCPLDCPTCNGPPQFPPPGVTPGPPPGNPITPSPPGNCPCPCPPCIWWPCDPCQPMNNCACNNGRG